MSENIFVIIVPRESFYLSAIINKFNCILSLLMRILSLSRSFRLCYIVFFLSVNCFLKNSYAQSNEIENQPIDSILVWMETNYNKDSNDFHSIALRTISKAKPINDAKLLGDLHTALASWHGFHGYTTEDSILFHDYKALEYYERIKDKSLIAKTLTSLSIDLSNAGKLDESQEVTFQAIELFEDLDDQLGMANCHRSLCYLFHDLKDYEKAIEYGLKAYDYYKKAEDYSRMSYTLLALIQSYKYNSQLDEAQSVAQECIDLVNNEIPHEVFVLGRAYSYKGRVSLQQGLLNQALEECTLAYDVVRKEVGDDRAASYRRGIGSALKEQKKCKEAIPHFEAAILRAEMQGNSDRLTLIYKSLSECYNNVGNTEKALELYAKYAEIEMNTRNEKIASLETEAVAKYESGRKDAAIAAQSDKLKQNSKIQLLGGGLLLVLATLLGSLFYNFRKNQKINGELALKNTENEFLVKEIHHRVKNNLQILSSLLSLQSSYITNEEAADAIKEGRNRVESMGMIHQRLYSGEDKTAIDLSNYLDDVCAYLRDSFLLVDKKIKIISDCDIGMADVETVIPLGLIINELITNSIKYAFDESQEGEILVKLNENDQDQLCLVVSDNGRGASEEGSFKDRSTNFGSDLVKVLIKKLKGELSQDTHNGYATTIVFDRYNLVSA